MAQHVIVVSDGSARPNPGVGRIGYLCALVQDGTIERVWCGDHTLKGQRTNNEAEYEAAIAGLRLAAACAPGLPCRLYVDSELLVRQIRGEYRAAEKFRGWIEQIREETYSVDWHSRTSTVAAAVDHLSRHDVSAALDCIRSWALELTGLGVEGGIEYVGGPGDVQRHGSLHECGQMPAGQSGHGGGLSHTLP